MKLTLLLLLCSMSSLAAQPPLVNKSTKTTAVFIVQWAKDSKEVNELCRDKSPMLRQITTPLAGCTVYNDDNMPLVIMIEPKDFSDHEALDTLGHEVWHVLGAKHQ